MDIISYSYADEAHERLNALQTNISVTGSITVNGYDVLTQNDVGPGATQIPLNQDLGSLAYVSLATTSLGGTGLNTYAQGDILYASAVNTLSALAKGTDNQVLTLSSGLPVWSNNVDTLQSTISTSSNQNYFISFVTSNSATAVGQTGYTSSNLQYNPSNGTIKTADSSTGNTSNLTLGIGSSTAAAGSAGTMYLTGGQGGGTGYGSTIYITAGNSGLNAASTGNVNISGGLLSTDTSGTLTGSSINISGGYTTTTNVAVGTAPGGDVRIKGGRSYGIGQNNTGGNVWISGGTAHNGSSSNTHGIVYIGSASDAGSYTDTSAVEIGASTITTTIHGTTLLTIANVSSNVTIGGALKGPATFYIDPSPDDTGEPGGATTDTGTVVILGDLQVTGATTTVNSTTVTINDLNLVLGNNATIDSEANGAGLTFGGQTNAPLLTYDSVNDRLLFSNATIVDVTGTLRENGNDVITQADVGSGATQIPVNQDLGSLAYVNSVDTITSTGIDLTVSTTNLATLSAENPTLILNDTRATKEDWITGDVIGNISFYTNDLTQGAHEQAFIRNVVQVGGTDAQTALAFGASFGTTSSTEVMRITSQGLSINSTAYNSDDLYVNGTSTFTGDVKLTGGTVNQVLYLDSTTNKITSSSNFKYDGSTAAVGTASLLASTGLNVSNTGLTGTSQYGTKIVGYGNVGATTKIVGLHTYVQTAASTFTQKTYGIIIDDVNKGSSSTIGENRALTIYNQSTFGSLETAVDLQMAYVSGYSRWNLYASGDAPNYMNGSLGIGNASFSDKLHVEGTAKVTSNLNVGGVIKLTDFDIDSGAGSTSSITQTSIYEFDSGINQAAKVIITANNGTDTYIVEMLVAINNTETTINATEYGQLSTGTFAVAYEVDISAGNARILATAPDTTATTYKISAQLM